MNIVAVCDNRESAKCLIEAGEKLGYVIDCEVQNNNIVEYELSNEVIKKSNVVLFVTDNSIEEIEGIERFIDREYYEVEPRFVIENPINVLNEIASDLN